MLFTFWVFPFTLALAIYAVILLIESIYFPFYAVYLAIYILDMLCQIITCYKKMRYQVYILIVNVGISLLSIGLLVYFANVSTRRILVSVWIFHFLTIVYTYYLAILVAGYNRSTLFKRHQKNRSMEDGASHRPSNDENEDRYSMTPIKDPHTMKRIKSENDLDSYFMDPIDNKDSMWSLTGGNVSK